MVKKLKGETPTLPDEEDRGTNLITANKNINQDPEEEDQNVNAVEKLEHENTNSEKNPNREDGEIGSEERSSHETPVVGDFQPNEVEGEKEEGSSSQTLSNRGDTREFNLTHNSSKISLTELEELVDVMGEWTKQMEALDRRVAALEEKDVNNMEALDRRFTALEEEGVNKMEGLDRRLAALETYVEKVGEDSPKDVKTRQKNGKGVKRTVHTLKDNLSTRSKKQK